ncbi:MAG: hypothetical protein J6K62_03080 [Clostridia bacterium]|nr:hypothetical protein [Clostridia bacterium]
MTLNVIVAAVFGAVTLYMATKEHRTVAYRMAWIPGVMAMMELAVCGIVFTAVPMALEVILMVCRITVLVCCSLALKKDAAKARNRRRRREVQRRVATDRMLYELKRPTAHHCA